MSNGNPGDPGNAQVKLAQVVAAANRPPEPSKWVQICQMGFAAMLFAGALAIALVLVLSGPPAPKSPDEPEGVSASAAAAGATAQVGPSTAFTSAGETEEGGEENEEEQEEDNGEEGNAEEGEASLANLNEQAPWAFAIVALLVGAFLATGKALNFSGTKGVVEPGAGGQ